MIGNATRIGGLHFLKSVAGDQPAAGSVGEFFDKAEMMMGEAVQRQPEKAARQLTELRTLPTEAFVKQLVTAAGGDSNDPAMQQLHESLVGFGLLYGVLGLALNAAVRDLGQPSAPPDPIHDITGE